MTLLDGATWQARVWTGAWTDGSGGTFDVAEPATGDVVGTVGRATPEDVAAAADRAAEAQRSWAALPFEDRARVLRRAAEMLEASADEITGWLARKTGAIQPFGGFQVHATAAECYEASALPSHPCTASCCAPGRPGCPSCAGCRPRLTDQGALGGEWRRRPDSPRIAGDRAHSPLRPGSGRKPIVL